MKLKVIETGLIYDVDKKLLKRVLLFNQLGVQFINPNFALINESNFNYLLEFENDVIL